jgi:NTE family protein
MTQKKDRSMKKPPAVALVLSGGGARAVAHLGVLSVLEARGIPIDCIAGASYGSIVAGYYACGYSIPSILERSRKMDKWVKTNRRRFRLDSGQAERELERDLGGARIEKLKIPIYILALDVIKGDVQVFQQGSLAKAMMASSAFPGLFEPVRVEDRLYVDGGVLNSMLLYLAQKSGANIIIYSDVSLLSIAHKSRTVNFFLELLLKVISLIKPMKSSKYTLHSVVFRVFHIARKYKRDCERYRKNIPDFILRPRVGWMKPLEFHRADEAFRAGQEAALRQIGSILRKCQETGSFK